VHTLREVKPAVKLAEIIRGIHKVAVHGDTSCEISGITKDSRNVSQGFLFFATSTSNAYVDDAFNRGAAAIITDREIDRPFPCAILVKDVMKALGQAASKFYGNPSRAMHIVGVTGTNGKTTITYLIESILKNGR
jgi:UDP-N-acetylmuramoyl-L-alanyl-D-glutamate--2,6-diaminopimelate ligase